MSMNHKEPFMDTFITVVEQLGRDNLGGAARWPKCLSL
jgi:hypothetical protein